MPGAKGLSRILHQRDTAAVGWGLPRLFILVGNEAGASPSLLSNKRIA